MLAPTAVLLLASYVGPVTAPPHHYAGAPKVHQTQHGRDHARH